MTDVAREPEPGDRLGRYTLVAPLGRGAAGVVWEAVLHGPQGFEKPVALKLLRDGPGGELLLQEARLGALVHHPNLVGALDLGEADGRWFFAMELVRGASLAELPLPLAPRAVVDVAVQVSAGLAHVHALRAGLVHRDLKPGNLLLDRSGLVRIADLGIARLVGTAAVVAGTAGYAPPEQLEGHEDQRSDLFALGAVIYRLATGRHPFGKGRRATIALARLARELADPAFLAPLDALVPGLGPIVGRCLRPEPSERFATASELGAAFAAVRANAPERGPTLLEALARVRPDLDLEREPRTPAPGSFLPVVPLPAGNVARPRDGFFGREDVLAALGQELDRPGVVTVLGPGGAGKTRVATEAACAIRLAGGAWFADLAEARDRDALCAGVARALGLDADGAGDPVPRVGRALAGRGRVLVVLDNLEQLALAAAPVVAAWATAAPEATLLCTSRTVLGLREEQRVVLGPLDRAAGVALFRSRSPRADAPDELVAALVDALDGLPLAIELAAARSRLLPVPALLARTADRLKLLAGGEVDRPERHRSIRASLDGSVELLAPRARDALGQLSTFEGGFALEAAEAVLSVDGWALDVVQELADASLVRVDETGRGSLLLVVQAYAAELVRERVALEQRHGAWFAQLGADAAIEGLRRTGGADRALALERERENLVAACDRAIVRGDAPVAAATLRAVWQVVSRRGPLRVAVDLGERLLGLPLDAGARAETLGIVGDGERLRGSPAVALARYEAALALPGVPDRIHVAVRSSRGVLHQHVGRMAEALADLEASCALAARIGSRADEARALHRLAVLHRLQGRLERSRELNGRALAIFRELGDREGIGFAVHNVAAELTEQGRAGEAVPHYEEALAAFRAAGDARLEAMTLGNLAVARATVGPLEEAEALARASLGIYRRTGDRGREGAAVGRLALLARRRGRLEEAEQLYREGIELAREAGNARSEAIALGNLGSVLVALGRLDDGRRHLERSLAAHRQAGDRRSEGIVLVELAGVARREGRAEAARALAEEAIRCLAETGEVESRAAALAVRAELARDAGDEEDARRWLLQAEALRR